MSYEVLARKWRPTDFSDVVSQNHVVTPLRNAIKTGRVPHAILLTGPRGIGKTTLARIIARCLNCQEGPTDTPCNKCHSCKEIGTNLSTDVQEIDAASRTSVDDVREIIESVRYSASSGKYRIFVIDEVHMLSTAAFNALLKTLEEPPPKSLFVLATTNPEKIPYTVVSRCQRYDLRQVSVSEIANRLETVAKSEGAKLTNTSLQAIARAAAGSLRDGLTLLDQLFAGGTTAVTDNQVAQMLDLIDREIPLSIIEGCIKKDPSKALLACKRAREAGIDARRLATELLQILRDLVVIQLAPKEPSLIEAPESDLAKLKQIATGEEPIRLRRMFRALIREQEDLAFAPDGFSVLEMSVIRLADLPSGDDVEALLSKLSILEENLRDGSGSQSTGSGGGSPTEPLRRDTKSSRVEIETTPDLKTISTKPMTLERSSAPETADANNLGTVFDRLRAFAEERNRGLFAGLEGGTLLEKKNGRLRISLPGGIASQRICARKADLEAVCEQFFSRRTEIDIDVSPMKAATETDDPEIQNVQNRETRKAALRHEAINSALNILEAEIVEIRPLSDNRQTLSDLPFEDH